MKRLWAWLTCWDALPVYFRHEEIRVVQDFGSARKIRCDRCGKYFGMHDETMAVLPWSEEMEDLYANTLGFGRTIR